MTESRFAYSDAVGQRFTAAGSSFMQNGLIRWSSFLGADVVPQLLVRSWQLPSRFVLFQPRSRSMGCGLPIGPRYEWQFLATVSQSRQSSVPQQFHSMLGKLLDNPCRRFRLDRVSGHGLIKIFPHSPREPRLPWPSATAINRVSAVPGRT